MEQAQEQLEKIEAKVEEDEATKENFRTCVHVWRVLVGLQCKTVTNHN